MKIKSILLITLFALSISACGNNKEEVEKEIVVLDDITETEDSKENISDDITETEDSKENISDDITDETNEPVELNIDLNISYMLNEPEDTDNTLFFTIDDSNGNIYLEDEYSVYFDSSWLAMMEESDYDIINLIDVNFDGYNDVVAQIFGAETNQYYRIYINDNNTFSRNIVYENLCNPIFNEESNCILSTNYGQAGIPSYEIFHVNDNTPILLGRIDGLVTDSGEVEYTETMAATYDDSKNIVYLDAENVNSITGVTELHELWNQFDIYL